MIVGWEWAFGTTVHFFRWRGVGPRGFWRVDTGEFQVAFNALREAS